MRIPRFALALALALIFLVTLLVSVPSRVLGLVLPGDQIIMHGYAGTLWQGSASRCLLRLPAGYIHLGAVSWSLDPLSLLLLAPRLTFSSQWGEQVVSGGLVLRGARDLDIIDLEGRVPANLVRHFAPLSLLGSLTVQVKQLQLRDGLPYSGAGRLVWQDGAWLSPGGQVPLGTYAIDFQQDPGEALHGQVLTLSGPLQAEGELELDDRAYRVDVLVSSDETLDAMLGQTLSLIAAPESAGHRISLDGDF